MSKRHSQNLNSTHDSIVESVEILPNTVASDYSKVKDTKVKSCRIRAIVAGQVYFEFDNFGLSISQDTLPTTPVVGDIIEISYHGEIGTASFQIL